MELWIRSQDKMKLVKVNYIYAMEGNDYFTIYGETIDSGPIIAKYKTKERALEVLDEIATTIKNRYIVKPNAILKQDDIAKEHKRLNYLYSGEFIMENPPYEIVPINSNIIYYEMPKEKE